MDVVDIYTRGRLGQRGAAAGVRGKDHGSEIADMKSESQRARRALRCDIVVDNN